MNSLMTHSTIFGNCGVGAPLLAFLLNDTRCDYKICLLKRAAALSSAIWDSHLSSVDVTKDPDLLRV